MSMPPIQSRTVEGNISNYFSTAATRKMVNQSSKQRSNELRTLSSFVVEDEHYKKVGSVSKGQRLKVFAKAGAFIEVREPICGWIQFKKVGNGQSMDYAMKCKESDDTESTNEKAADHQRLKKMARDKGSFSIFMTKHYAKRLKGVEVKGDDGEYEVM